MQNVRLRARHWGNVRKKKTKTKTKKQKKQKKQELKNVKFSFWLYMDLMYT